MELPELLKISVLLLSISVFGNAMNIPNIPNGDVDMSELSPDMPEDIPLQKDPRATWLETKSLGNLETETRNDLVYLAITDLIKDGRLSHLILGSVDTMKDKRGRWQGFCFRRTRSGRFLPYICWKDDNNS